MRSRGCGLGAPRGLRRPRANGCSRSPGRRCRRKKGGRRRGSGEKAAGPGQAQPWESPGPCRALATPGGGGLWPQLLWGEDQKSPCLPAAQPSTPVPRIGGSRASPQPSPPGGQPCAMDGGPSAASRAGASRMRETRGDRVATRVAWSPTPSPGPLPAAPSLPLFRPVSPSPLSALRHGLPPGFCP